MLQLRFPVAEGAEGNPRHVTLSRTTALSLERALLMGDIEARHQVVAVAVASDEQLSAWTLRTAECELGRTVNKLDEAARWLGDRLATQLAASLEPATAQTSTDVDDFEERFGALVALIASYEARLSAFEQRLENEKLEALKELAYGASHEINNPLANIAARAQMLLVDEADPERQHKLSAIHRQAMRAHEMISDLMLFARPPKLQLETVDLEQLLRQTSARLSELAAECEATLELQIIDEGLQAQADATQIAVAVQALVVNSLEAVGPGGQVHISLRRATVEEQYQAEIVVLDDGPGIPPDVRRHMFDPFYSGREAGRGLGFGLSKCWRIITDHGGHIDVRQPPGSGAEIAICLPLRITHDSAD